MPHNKLNDKKLKTRLVAALRTGNTREVACKFADISRRSFYDWLKWADDESHKQHATAKALALEVFQAEAEAEMAMVGIIRTAALTEKQWTAAAWWLERKKPDVWGKRVIKHEGKIDTGTDEKMAQVMAAMTNEQLEAIAAVEDQMTEADDGSSTASD